MKLVFFTPAKEASAIGSCCSLVTKELIAQGHEVVVVRTETERLLKDRTHNFGTPVLSWTQADAITKAAKDADAVIYQIGNSFDFHKGALFWLEKLSGIVILHDFFLGHLFWSWAQADLVKAKSVLEAWYGEKVAGTYFTNPGSTNFIDRTIDTAPMTEWVCSMATAVITHSSWGCDRVLKSCAGPVRVIPLTPPKELNSYLSASTFKPTKASRFTITTFGHINQNKRAESIIKAIGNSPLLRENSVYQLAGSIQPNTVLELSNLARSHGVDIVIHGEVSDQILTRAIQRSDVITCLRWPSLEAASASLIEALLSGRSTIVTDTGFYADIPSSCVLKVRPTNELEDIQSALELLFTDRERRQAIGEEGQRWASTTFTVENYAKELANAVNQAAIAKPTLDAVRSFYGNMARWEADDKLLNTDEILKPLQMFGTA